MKFINHKTFEDFPIKGQAKWLEDNNIFVIKNYDKTNELHNRRQRTSNRERLDISYIIGNNSFEPTKESLHFTYGIISSSFRKLKDNLTRSGTEIRLREYYQNEKKGIPTEYLKPFIKKLKYKLQKPFKMGDSNIFHKCSISKVNIEKRFEDYWLTESLIMIRDLSYINMDILTFVKYGEGLSESEFSKYSTHFQELEHAMGIQKFLKFLKFELLELKITNQNEDDNFSVLNIKNKINRYPDIFTGPYGCEFFRYCLSNDTNHSNRNFSIYLNIFQTKKLIHNHHGLKTKYEKFIKKRYNYKMSKAEKNINRDIGNELGEINRSKHEFDILIKSIDRQP